MLKVAYTSPLLPVEWLLAHGVLPVRTEPHIGKALVETSRAAQMGACPYALEFAYQSENKADLIVFVTECDQMRRANSYIGVDSDKIFVFNFPSTRTPEAALLFAHELHRLSGQLRKLGAKTPSENKLNATLTEVMLKTDRLRGQILKLPPQKKWRGLLTLGGLEQNNYSAQKVDAGKADKIPVAIIGGPLNSHDSWIFNTVQSMGGEIILDATDTSSRTQPRSFDPSKTASEPLQELIRAYLDILCINMRPDTKLFSWLTREIKNSGARGIILRRYTNCDLWAASVMRIKEATGLLLVELDSGGESQELARDITRLEAFMETLA